MRISDWSSDVCSSDLASPPSPARRCAWWCKASASGCSTITTATGVPGKPAPPASSSSARPAWTRRRSARPSPVRRPAAMHLLQATPGSISDGSEAIDLGQDPGDIVFLSAADSELAALAAAQREVGASLGEAAPSLRLANLMQLGHNMSVDLYVEQVVAAAKLVVVRLLGGESYWPYGVEQLHAACRERGIKLAMLPAIGRAHV